MNMQSGTAQCVAVTTWRQNIDLLVNAAGLFIPKPFLDYQDADYDQYTPRTPWPRLAGLYSV
ncbi:MAG: hypothetical protein WD623_02250 [Marinobacter sp.]|uniref:hypothetical protein n=1 Tax=Marinobacter sp. TaxID=50741 RepID=UPI0034A1AA85